MVLYPTLNIHSNQQRKIGVNAHFWSGLKIKAKGKIQNLSRRLESKPGSPSKSDFHFNIQIEKINICPTEMENKP